MNKSRHSVYRHTALWHPIQSTVMLSVIYAECHLCCAPYKLLMLSVDMLNVSMLNVVMLNVIILNVVMLNVVMLNVVMLNVVMLNVVMLNVVILNVVLPSAVMLNVVAPLRIPICKNEIEPIILLNIAALCSLPRHFSWYRARAGFEPLISGPVVECSTTCLHVLD
jgi:hypothetical protein